MPAFAVIALLALFAADPALAAPAQDATNPAATAPQTDRDAQLRIRLPVLTVTAEKEPEDPQRVPVSVTAVPKDTLESAGVRAVSEAGDFAPNAFFSEFTARKLSNPRFRGVGSGPTNPGVTTYFDGVPQLNANSSSIELMDVQQIEFVRGAQSALFGRNTIGGLINVASSRPSLDRWTGNFTGGPFGNIATVDTRGGLSGPLAGGRLGLGVALGYSARDGFTRNDVTGNDLDFRSALFTKGQLLWTPSANWEARLILTGERARDGDYALSDLGALRTQPFHASHDYEGFTHRDIVAPTYFCTRRGRRWTLPRRRDSCGGRPWTATDLDYSPYPLAIRDNDERDFQFTQEVRLASARDSGIQVSRDVMLTWQGGVFVFTQDYEQKAVNSYSPSVLSSLVDFPVSEHSPEASLDDRGIGVYGQGTFTVRDKLEGSIGLRGDYEHKAATLDTFYEPPIAPPATVQQEKGFGDVSPQFTVAYRLTPDGRTLYGRVARGFKAGGFNAASPPGSESYDEEHSWSYEGGAKTTWFGDRLAVNAAAFYLTWDDLQVYVPSNLVLGQFFIGNAAGATSKGIEVEMNARAFVGCDFFAGLGYTNVRFDDGSVSNGIAVGGNRPMNTPNYTADFGGQYSVAVTSSASLYARAEFAFRGDYFYDDANTEGQDAYSLANFRFGVRARRVFAEAWTRNAFDSRYFPVAFAYRSPSGFLAESGAPRMYGVRAGLTF